MPLPFTYRSIFSRFNLAAATAAAAAATLAMTPTPPSHLPHAYEQNANLPRRTERRSPSVELHG